MRANTHYFITGISTEVGKTITSAIWVQAWGLDYWKPIQCGDLEASDSLTVKSLVQRQDIKIYPEAQRFKLAQSPHWASAKEGVNLSTDAFDLPPSSGLVIEGAGGILTPLNKQETMLDLAWKFESNTVANSKAISLEMIVVVKPYLGCLNHTILTCEAIKQRQLTIAGLVISGDADPEIIDFLCEKTQLPLLMHLPNFSRLNPDVVASAAAHWVEKIKKDF